MSADEIRDYLLMARALISQGAVEVERPAEKYVQWARWAIHATDVTLNDAVAKLAEGTALARGERYIEVQIISPRAAPSDPIVDLEVPDRFALLRAVANDHRRFSKAGLRTNIEGEAAVLFSSFEAALEAARALRLEVAFSDTPAELLMYAAIFQPVLPAEFLEEGTDPLAPARDFLKSRSAEQAQQVHVLVRGAVEPVQL